MYVQIDKSGIEVVYLEKRLVVWDISHEYGSISRSKKINHSVEWIKSVKDDISQEAYVVFCSKYVLSHVDGMSIFCSLYKEMVVNDSVLLKVNVAVRSVLWLFVRRLKSWGS